MRTEACDTQVHYTLNGEKNREREEEEEESKRGICF